MLNLNNTLDGYLKNVEVIGNTIQDTNNLADIRSVGDKVEGQEMYEIPVVSCGKNLNSNTFRGSLRSDTGEYFYSENGGIVSDYVRVYNGMNLISSVNGKVHSFHYVMYDNNKNKIKSKDSHTGAYVVDFNGYIRVWRNAIDDNLIQIEEGTQATPYEPYQGQKLEILSPVQLEKVGDVADRIICKDGVWGVEKNVVDFTLIGNEDWLITDLGTTLRCGYNPNLNLGGVKAISDRFVYESGYDVDKEHFYISNNAVWIFIDKSVLSSATNSGVKEYLTKNNVLIKYPTTTQPQFIPLPHDQQVKLRTFAGQTNISFLTEIPGQIKAQVPKSLGATVNTHTEQIADLHNSLDRVKKLEETTVSTVETVSGFTTVDATSNGYFEGVKLEGKTLVNLASMTGAYIRKDTGNVLANDVVPLLQGLKANTTYTRIINVSKVILGTVNSIKMYDALTDVNGVYKQYSWSYITTPGVYMDTFTVGDADTTSTYSINPDARAFNGTTGAELEIDKMVILEGDHTNNPPGYYKGLMSVGQDVEEVSVESVKGDGNLIVGEFYKLADHIAGVDCSYLIKNTTYTINFDIDVAGGLIGLISDKSKPENTDFLISNWGVVGNTITFTTPQSFIEKEYTIIFRKTDIHLNMGDKKAILNKSTTSSPYTPYQSNKKPLLYYNPTTEMWEKPVLREWDTIEKHSDGKYYYHKRSGEVVLNGSESFKLNGNFSAIFGNTETVAFSYAIQGYLKNPTPNTILCDTFRTDLSRTDDIDGIYNFDAYVGFNTIVFKILKGKLATPDVEGFKAWLKANPTKLVYKLEQEEVYECTNIDLMTYSGETNYIINSGAISPKSLLKVHNNISNVVKILQEKVSLLENTFIAGLKSVLSGDMYSLATILYPEDFEQNDNTEQDIMVIPE